MSELGFERPNFIPAGATIEAYSPAEINDLHTDLNILTTIAENRQCAEINTCAAIEDAWRQIRVECLDGTYMIVRPEIVYDAEPRPGRTYPVRFHIDTPLDPQEPEALSRITIHGENDDQPSVISGVRLVHGADGAVPETIPLSDEELMGAVAQIQACAETGQFIGSWMNSVRQVPGLQESIEGPEAEEAQHIVDTLLAAEGISPADIDPDTPLEFAVWDDNDFAYPFTIHRVTVTRVGLDGYNSNDNVTEVYFTSSDDSMTRPFIVQINNYDSLLGQDLRFFGYDQNEPGPEGSPMTAMPLALSPEDRLRMLAAMRWQLIDNASVFRVDANATEA